MLASLLTALLVGLVLPEVAASPRADNMFRRARVKPRPREHRFDANLMDFVPVNAAQEPDQQATVHNEEAAHSGEDDLNGGHDLIDDNFEAGWRQLAFADRHAGLQQARVHTSDTSWLDDKLQGDARHAVRVLAFDGNRKKLTLMSPSHDMKARWFGTEERQQARDNPFCLIDIRLLTYEDGSRFCSNCTNPGCQRSKEIRETFRTELRSELHIGQYFDDLSEDEPALCKCAAAVVGLLWSSVGDVGPEFDLESGSLAEFFMEQEPFEARAQSFEFKGWPYKVVNSGEEGAPYAFLRKKKEPSRDSYWECMTCPRNKSSCVHNKAAGTAPTGAGLSNEAYERELANFLGSDGARALTCISRNPIPEDIELSDKNEQSLSLRLMTQSAFPPDADSSKCPLCGMDVHTDRITAKLFHERQVQDIIINEYTCSGQCGYKQGVDGSEFCFLRKQAFKSEALGCFEIVFSWDFLYYVRDQIEEGVYYYSVLKQLMKWYKRDPWRQFRLCGLQSLYPILKEAFMDFIDLMALPLNSPWCTCGGQMIIADGVTVAPRRGAMNMKGDWLPVRPAGQALVAAQFGSDYHGRFAVQEKTVRACLRQLTCAGGCTYAQLLDLCDVCKDQEEGLQQLFDRDVIIKQVGDGGLDAEPVDLHVPMYLLELVDAPDIDMFIQKLPNGMFTVPQWSRSFLRELSADSPAVAIVPLKDTVLLQHWRDCVTQRANQQPVEAAWSAADDAEVLRSMPCLWECLKTIHGLAKAGKAQKLCLAFASLVLSLTQAAKRCCTPEQAPKEMPSFQPEHRWAKSRRQPETVECRSADEAMYRTGLSVGHMSREQARRNSGLQRLPLFASDASISNKSCDDCVKHKTSSGALGPGLMVLSPLGKPQPTVQYVHKEVHGGTASTRTYLQILWCVLCKCAVAWSLMPDSESPATLFELLYVFFPAQQAKRVVYDNGCNFLTYALNRDPVWAGWVRVFVDELHWKGHTKCAKSFDTGSYKDGDQKSADPIIANPSFAEQENSALKRLKSSAVHMRQTHLLWLIRFLLYRQWQKKNLPHLRRNPKSRPGHMPESEVVLGPTPSQPHEVADVLDLVLPAM